MQNNIPTVYISEIHCCVVKSTNLSIFVILYKKYKKIKNFKNILLSWQHLTPQRETAFIVGQ